MLTQGLPCGTPGASVRFPLLAGRARKQIPRRVAKIFGLWWQKWTHCRPLCSLRPRGEQLRYVYSVGMDPG